MTITTTTTAKFAKLVKFGGCTHQTDASAPTQHLPEHATLIDEASGSPRAAIVLALDATLQPVHVVGAGAIVGRRFSS